MPAVGTRILGQLFLCPPVTDPHDKRYQRPWWFRGPRWLVQRPWLSLVAYLGAAFRDSFLSLWHQGPRALEPTKLIVALLFLKDQIRAAFLSYIAPWVTHNPLVFTLLILLVLLVAWLALRARCDTMREKAVMLKRLLQDEMAKQLGKGNLYIQGYTDGYGKGFIDAFDLKERRYLNDVHGLAGEVNVQREFSDIDLPRISAQVDRAPDDGITDDPAP